MVSCCSAHSDVNSNESSIVLTNLFDGLDRYDLNENTQAWAFARHYDLPVTQNITLPVLFIDNGKFILCGSDNGHVRIFDAQNGTIAQTLVHGGRFPRRIYVAPLFSW